MSGIVGIIWHFYTRESGSAAVAAELAFNIPAGGQDQINAKIPNPGPPAIVSIFVDNSANNSPVLVTFGDTGYSFAAPSKTQGWYRAIATQGRVNITMACAVAANVTAYVTDQDISPNVWTVV
jgi:hypothetical protein